MFIEDGAGPKAAESLLCLRYFRRSSLPHQSCLWTTLALPEQLSISQHQPQGLVVPQQLLLQASEVPASPSLSFLPRGRLGLFLETGLCCFACQRPRLFSSVAEPCGRSWLSLAFLEASV